MWEEMRMRNLIGRIFFWFIKEHLEVWNHKKAGQRVKFYRSMFLKEKYTIVDP
jgi:hypothetical protein